MAAHAAAVDAGGCLSFSRGTYAFATPIVITDARLCWMMDPRAELKYTGTATTNAITFDGTSTAIKATLSGLRLNGNGLAVNGVKFNYLQRSLVRALEVRNVSGAGIYCAYCVITRFERPQVSGLETAFTTTPTNGIVLDELASNQPSTDVTIVDPIIEGVSGSGIKCVKCNENTITGGTVENNGVGIELTSTANVRNVFRNIQMESNVTADIDCTGIYSLFDGIQASSSGGIIIRTTARQNTLLDGLYAKITIEASANGTRLIGTRYTTGGLTDGSATYTTQVGVYDGAGDLIKPAAFPIGISVGAGADNTVVCWKAIADGKRALGYATVAEITAGTCH
jgi:hypothetical protein